MTEWGNQVLRGHQTHCLLSLCTSNLYICPTEDEPFRQLRGMDALSNVLWPEAFGQALDMRRAKIEMQPSCAHSCMIQTSTAEISLLDFDVWVMHGIEQTNARHGILALIYTHPCANVQQLWDTNTHIQSEWHHKHIKLGKSFITTLAPAGPDSPAAVIAVKRQL